MMRRQDNRILADSGPAGLPARSERAAAAAVAARVPVVICSVRGSRGRSRPGEKGRSSVEPTPRHASHGSRSREKEQANNRSKLVWKLCMSAHRGGEDTRKRAHTHTHTHTHTHARTYTHGRAESIRFHQKGNLEKLPWAQGGGHGGCVEQWTTSFAGRANQEPTPAVLRDIVADGCIQ